MFLCLWSTSLRGSLNKGHDVRDEVKNLEGNKKALKLRREAAMLFKDGDLKEAEEDLTKEIEYNTNFY